MLSRAQIAKEAGASRFCMGAAWRSVRDGREFDAVVDMVKGVRDLGMEACVTLGMLQPHQAQRLAEAGLTAYNHNLDTSPEFYGEIVSTRTYQERLDTLGACPRRPGWTLCCGGIIGMGEKEFDRASLLRVLSEMNPHPESVPVNALVAVRGTPMEGLPPVDSLRHGADDRGGAHRHAEVARAPFGRPQRNERRGAGPVLHGRRQFDLLRRKAADHRQ